MDGNAIRVARVLVGKSQRQLGELVGVTQHKVWCWENGQAMPTPEQWSRITSTGLPSAMREMAWLASVAPVRGAGLSQTNSGTFIPSSSRMIQKPAATPEREPTLRELYAAAWARHHPPRPSVAQIQDDEAQRLAEGRRLSLYWLSDRLAASDGCYFPGDTAGRPRLPGWGPMQSLEEWGEQHYGPRLGSDEGRP